MTLSFLSLPPEVRNQIYGYIFTGKCESGLVHAYPKVFATNSGYWNLDAVSKFKRNPRLKAYWMSDIEHSCFSHAFVVQTCQQIYQETNALLYAGATFVYSFWEGPQPIFNLQITPCLFPKKSLEYVKNLELLLARADSVPLEIIVEAIAGLLNAACVLERLTVKSKFTLQHESKTDIAWLGSILHNEAVLGSIKTLESLRDVHIIVEDEKHTNGAGFAILTQVIAAAKGWISYEGQETAPDCLYTDWSWSLQPASQEVNTVSVEPSS